MDGRHGDLSFKENLQDVLRVDRTQIWSMFDGFHTKSRHHCLYWVDTWLLGI